MDQTIETIKTLFDAQPFAVLATHDGGQPYVSLMAVAATDDLKCLLFATERNTRKYANLVSNPRVALLVDNRSNQVSDTRQAIAVTALGEMRESDKEQHLSIFLKKHPHLKAFVEPPSCALVEMQVINYFVVEGLRDVREHRMTSGGCAPRCYTLTHSDATGDLFLAIGPEHDRKQISG